MVKRVLFVVALAAWPIAAQRSSPVVLPPRFSLPVPEPSIRKPVQRMKFAAAVGRRAAILGREDGTFEAWINPVQILRDFHLTVYLDDSLHGVPLADLAESITTAPGRTTVTYAHALFTIRQTWFAPLDKTALVVLLDVETSHPLRLRAAFVPELRPMWPASFGSRSYTWAPNDHLFVLGEGTGRHAAVVGSPLFARGSEEPAMLEMDVAPDVARSHLVPIVIAASAAGEEGARKAYRETLAALGDLITESDGYYRDFQSKTLRIQTPEPLLNQAFEWAKFALDKGWQCNDKVGCGQVAGSRARRHHRQARARLVLRRRCPDRFLEHRGLRRPGPRARHPGVPPRPPAPGRQDPGPVDAERRGLVDWSQYPYGFVHAEATPLYLFSAARYVVRSGDQDFLRVSWPSLQKAYRYCLSTTDTDGLMSNRTAGPAAAAATALAGRIEKDIYLEGAWLAGLDGYGILAGLAKNSQELEQARKHLEQARKSLDAWFREDRGYFPFARLQGGGTYDGHSSWQALALAYGGVDARKAERASSTFARTQMTTPWGTRRFATDAAQQDPAGGIDTTVWPLTTAFVALAEFRNHQSRRAVEHLYSVASLTGFNGAGFVPEELSGDRAQTMPHSVPQQLFSSAAVIHPMVRGLLGLGGDALEGTFSFVPHLPAHWPSLKFELYRIGQSWVSGEMEHQLGQLRIKLTVIGKPLKIYLAPALPLNTTIKNLKVNGKKASARLETFDTDVHAVLEVNSSMGLEAIYQFREGVEARPDLPVFEVGQAAAPPVQGRAATAAR